MAITRAQQAKQMLQDGGMLVKPSTDGKRPGYSNPNEDRNREEARDRARTQTATQQQESYERAAYDPGPSSPPAAAKGSTNVSYIDSRGNITNTAPKNVDFLFDDDDDVAIESYESEAFDKKDPRNPSNTLNTLYATGVPKTNFPGFLGAGLNALTPFRNIALRKNIDYFRELKSRGRLKDYDLTAEGYEKYIRARMAGEIDAAGNSIPQRDDDGPDSILPLLPQQPVQDPTTMLPQISPEFFRFMADGGMTNDAPMMQGGITDLALRDEFFLGGVVKGIKKGLKGVTRAVKKIAKSPIGKAALFAGIAGIPFGGSKFFGSGSLFGKASGLLKSQGVKDFFFKDGVPGFKNLSTAGMVTPLLAAPFIGELLGLNKQDEQVVDRGPGVDFNAQQFYRLAADGGLMRQQYQEGSKEPVAKKTMPLLDMGGKEKDYRETGGFVDMGRMEKADDVPARLSKNEFVFTADAVRNAGDGDVDKGAEVMYNMMKNLESGGDVSEESQGLEGAREMFQTSKRLEEVL